MKKIIMSVLVIFVAFAVSACNNAAPQKEMGSITNGNETIVDLEETIPQKEMDSTINDNETSDDVEEASDETNYDKVSAYMEEECRKAFSPYYELLDFQISDYQEEVVDGNVEAIFSYKMIKKNYDKDPGTVVYIKEAKERGNENYQQMYDEYLQPTEMNFHLKTIMDENNEITLYFNIAPKGIEWEETKMTDFIMK